MVLETPWQPRFRALPPLALYVHIPWCVRKCPYCDFNSHEARPGSGLPELEYVDALVRDLEGLLPAVWGRPVTSLFIGGGTPSLFSPRSIDRLLSEIRARVVLDPEAEITMEANPGTVEAARFRGYRDAGVNRLSIGVQSLNDALLEKLGRIHDAAEARRAIDAALSHFDNVNIDLMYGLPGQSLAQAREEMSIAAGLGASHVSAYQLSIEPNTVFFRRRPELPPHDVCADMQIEVEQVLVQAGYEHYETSAFAHAGRRSRHNVNYWEFGDYLGIGAGAHGKISFPDRVTRHARARQPREYMERAATGASITEETAITPRELPFEFMLNALRLVEGFDPGLFQARTGLALAVVEAALKRAEARGLIERSAVRVRPTELGGRFLNDLLELFLPPRRA